jgi:hypothetical protein
MIEPHLEEFWDLSIMIDGLISPLYQNISY